MVTLPPRPRRRFWNYAIELSIGSVAGLAMFLVLLSLLQLVFPNATSFGDLVRSRRAALPRPLVAAPEAPLSVALLSEVRRDVRSKPSDSVAWSSARRGAKLSEGDAVQSYEGSGATILFDAGNSLALGEKSLIVLRALRAPAGENRRRASVLFMDGFLRGELRGSGAEALELEVLAAGGVVRPREREGQSVKVAMAFDSEQSLLSVEEGDAEVLWEDRVTVVPAGHMVVVDPASGPARPVRLPQPAVPLSPADGERFLYRGTPPRIVFSWRATDDASQFTLQLAHDPGFAEIVFTQRLAETSFAHGALSAGEYYWRVLGCRGPILGPAGQASRLTIESARRPPKLHVELPATNVDGRTVLLRGETEPGCRVLVGETSVPIDAAGRFESELELRDGYNFIVVQAIDALGNTAFENRTIVAGGADVPRSP